MSPATFLMAVGSVTLNALAQIALRKTMLALPPLPTRMNEVLHFAPSLLLSPWFLSGMACYAISICVWMLVLGRAEVSLAYPLLSIGYVITAIIGYAFLGEQVTIHRILGIAIICVGIVVISRGG